MKVGQKFLIKEGVAKVSGVYANGFHYHTLNQNGDCIIKERYCLHSEYAMIRVEGE